MMKIINKENWNKYDNIILEESAFQSVTSQNNILVIAGPGTGKTELLAQKLLIFYKQIFVKIREKYWRLVLRQTQHRI